MNSIFHARFHACLALSRVIADSIRLVQLEPNQIVHVMTPSEALDHAVSMLPHAPRKVGGNSDVQRAISLAGKEIDTRKTLAHAQNPSRYWV